VVPGPHDPRHGEDPATYARAEDINNRGEVVDRMEYGGFAWRDGVLTVLPDLGNNSTVAAAGEPYADDRLPLRGRSPAEGNGPIRHGKS
jgi:hypothetical protein